MFEILYNIFIMPVETLIEIVFYTMNRFFADAPAVSVIFLSIVVNLLILPLYKRADDMQEAERDKQKKMERWNKHISKTFKGDEKYMMQNAYYRIENYKPLQAITGSLSLLFQIPFFMAAYHFLSHLPALSGAEFMFIKDLGKPDALFSIGSFAINIMPILMTVINIVSGMIYTKGFKLKDKLQLYGMALLFLVILYNSPAGLVLYWTCNNLFSLGKNIFFKYVENKRDVINVVAAVDGTGLFFFMLSSHRLVLRRDVFLFAIIMLISYLPLVFTYLGKLKAYISLKEKISKILNNKQTEIKSLNGVFISGALLLTIIMGIMIPAILIETSPIDFAANCIDGPLFLILKYTLPVYFGLFVVWFGIFYWISKGTLKKIFAYAMWIMAGVAILDYYAFFAKLGIMNYNLVFDNAPVYNDLSKVINILIIIPVVVLLFFLVEKWPKIVSIVMVILSIAFLSQGIISMNSSQELLKESGYYEISKDLTIEPTVPLSKNGKNVIVIMLDRALGEYVPYVFNEKPELAKKYEDFVYYPNTLSFGGFTNLGAPALFGGYEYTPTELNKRDAEPMVDKHDEALLVMPVTFAKEGYEVYVADPPYAGYEEYSDLSIFDPYDNITGLATRDRYVGNMYEDFDSTSQKKHMFMYSLFRTAPVAFQNSIYDEGYYLGKPEGDGDLPACAEGYAFLNNLDTYTYVEKDDVGRVFIMSNLITHEPSMLETPGYVVSKNPDDFPYSQDVLDSYIIDGERLNMDSWGGVTHYHVNMAAYILLGNYFDYLREKGIYDNTRIIIVSDHGRNLYQRDEYLFDEYINVESYNPVLFVKDFADSDELAPEEYESLVGTNIKVSYKFMTNADVPTMAMAGLIDNPTNPFTGKVINNDEKYAHPQRVTVTGNSDIYRTDGNKYETDGYPWYDVWDNIFDKNNWVKVEE